MTTFCARWSPRTEMLFSSAWKRKYMIATRSLQLILWQRSALACACGISDFHRSRPASKDAGASQLVCPHISEGRRERLSECTGILLQGTCLIVASALVQAFHDAKNVKATPKNNSKTSENVWGTCELIDRARRNDTMNF